uniref:Uncharacterized protein n=1 Tax=Triticum urartu TaxID=4572 RepID=A0A8R7QXC0_TRIUA
MSRACRPSRRCAPRSSPSGPGRGSLEACPSGRSRSRPELRTCWGC